jgi:hypothetical protein
MMIITGINLIMHTSRIDEQITSNTNKQNRSHLFQTLVQGIVTEIEIDRNRLHTVLQENSRSHLDSRWLCGSRWHQRLQPCRLWLFNTTRVSGLWTNTVITPF